MLSQSSVMRIKDDALVRVLGAPRTLEGIQADNEAKAEGQSRCKLKGLFCVRAN